MAVKPAYVPGAYNLRDWTGAVGGFLVDTTGWSSRLAAQYQQIAKTKGVDAANKWANDPARAKATQIAVRKDLDSSIKNNSTIIPDIEKRLQNISTLYTGAIAVSNQYPTTNEITSETPQNKTLLGPILFGIVALIIFIKLVK